MFGTARAAIRALYAAKIEATRRHVPRRDLVAALRALRDAQHAELRTLALRRVAALRAARERRETERFGWRLAQQEARAPPASRPR